MEDERNSACLCHWHHGVASELWSKAWALSLAKAGELLQNSSFSKANGYFSPAAPPGAYRENSGTHFSKLQMCTHRSESQVKTIQNMTYFLFKSTSNTLYLKSVTI